MCVHLRNTSRREFLKLDKFGPGRFGNKSMPIDQDTVCLRRFQNLPILLLPGDQNSKCCQIQQVMTGLRFDLKETDELTRHTYQQDIDVGIGSYQSIPRGRTSLPDTPRRSGVHRGGFRRGGG